MSEPATSWIAGSLPSSSERSSSSAIQIEVKEDIMKGNFYRPCGVTEEEEKEDKMDTSSNQPTSIQDYTSVNIEDPELLLATDVIKKLQNDLDSISSTISTTACCIYRVPPTLRQGEEKEDKMDTSSNQLPSIQDYTSVNIEDSELQLAACIKEQLQDLYPISTACCIYRVPPTLRQVSEKSYTPQTVSVGPFHHGKKELEPWEEYKLRYSQAFLQRTNKSLEDCIKLVKDWEVRARNCYRGKIDLSSNEFVYMMLVDSCFIIEVMWRFAYNLGEGTDYLNNPDLITIVQRDLVLLENQIPFFVLHGLYKLGFSEDGEDDFLELSIKYLSDLLLTTEIGDTFNNVKRHQKSGFKILHLTDLLRICHLPTDSENTNRGNFVPIPTAARLHEAGMKFKIGTGKRVLDMKYNPTGLLEMPKFQVHNHTECLVRNLTALEMCHYPFDSYIIDYVYFMDRFIDTATDADLLIQKGIIENFMSDSAEVASVFNNLPKETTLFTNYYYFQIISKDINAYYNVPWHKWKATFKRDYCSTPWMIAATAAAILLLVLTLIQAICSIISLF